MGARTALVTHRFATIGAMSCNPAIGGLGKGHLVREIDALDGLMGRVADARRHPVPRAQPPQGSGGARAARPGRPQALCRGDAAGDPRDRQSHRDRGRGRRPDRPRTAASPAFGSPTAASLAAGAVVLTTGTFLRGLIHIGETNRSRPGGSARRRRSGCRARWNALGFALGRLKTGTPPRLDGRTIDWAALEMQPGDDPPEPFSALTDRIDNAADPVRRSPAPPRRPTRSSAPMCIARRCIPARSRAAARAIARRSRTRSSASASATGTRSSWSRKGSTTPTVYPNGISTSLPEEVQLALVATIPGPGAGADAPARLCHRIRPCRSARARPDAGDQAPAGAVPGRPDQRHHRLRGGGGAGPGRRPQRRVARGRRRADRVRPRRGLSRRDDRRPGDARGHRAVPHVHLARGVPADAAGRQCRPAPDRQGHCLRLRRAGPAAAGTATRWRP